MRATLRAVWDKLHASYWFIPMLLMLLAACLAFTTLALDSRIRGKILEEQAGSIAAVQRAREPC